MTRIPVRQCIRLGAFAFAVLSLFLFVAGPLNAQEASATIAGTVADAQGGTVSGAVVTATNTATGEKKTVRADGNGAYSIEGLAAGTYTVEAVGNGFAPASKAGIVLTAGQTQQVALALQVGAVTQEITVNAGVDSIAVKAAPSGGYLEERSARSLVSNTYIENYTSPVADYGELVQIVPGAFTTSGNGVGLGQSKTYFRGFPDGDYNIDFDGIPFYDTNSPTHHSWSFFPSQWIGGVDFDRSPGSAITIGPTPFGGSIHFLSKPLTSQTDYRVGMSYGTWNTKLYDGAFNSGNFGLFGSPAKSNLFADVHHMTSDGYQTFNFNMRTAGSLLYQYQFSPKTVLTGYSGVVHLNSNGPNISSTRCMLDGVSSFGTYSCANADTSNGLAPFTGAGIKFLLTNNSDPASWFDYRYNTYQVYTDVEYVGLRKELPKSWYLDVKGYTLNYDNGELYSNAVPITEVTQAQAAATPSLVPGAILVGGKAYYDGVLVAPCNVGATKKGVTALPCGIDKYNSYRKYGENLMMTQTSSFGVFRAGLWYEWARTNRHQYPSDPINNWADQSLPKFNEQFWTNSYQPYAEYEFHPMHGLNITAGTKFAAYTIDVLHHADDGATVGELTCTSTTAACPATIEDHGTFTAWLPSLDINYRLRPNLSVYAQGATGSIVPPSAVYDYNQTAASASAAVPILSTPPKQQRSTTYQIGSVFKANRVAVDADLYRVRFQNTYSSTIDNIPGDVDQGDTIFYLQPSSVTEGLEFETTVVLTPGLNLYLNGTVDNAYYEGKLNANTTSTALTAPIFENAPGGLWVAQTPTDTETEGLTYEKHGFNLGMFNKRVGDERIDNGQYHNQGIIPQFSSLGAYVNYTVGGHSLFDQTKIRLSATNLMDGHYTQANSLAGSPNLVYLNGGGTCSAPTGTNPCDAFRTAGATPLNGQDTPSLMAGRSFSVSVQFGFAPEGKK